MESNTEERLNLFKLPEKKGALYELKKNPDDAQEVLEFKYIEKRQITHDTFVFVYEIPNDLPLGLNLGQHIAIDAYIKTTEFPEGEPVCRKYTPISNIFMKGRVEVLIKVYFKDVHPQYPEGGRMSQYLNDLDLEKTIQVRGPFGKLSYLGDGKFKILKRFKPVTYSEKKYKRVGMIAGGTGITPFYQLLQAADMNKDTCEFGLVFGNRTSKDILLKDELDQMYRNQNFKFNLCYTINEMEEGWTGNTGHITKEMISATCPAPDDEAMMLTCGPPVMCRKFLLPMLLAMGYKEENIFDF